MGDTKIQYIVNVKIIMLLKQNTTNSLYNYMQMSGSPVFPATEIFLVFSLHGESDIINRQENAKFFHFPPQKGRIGEFV